MVQFFYYILVFVVIWEILWGWVSIYGVIVDFLALGFVCMVGWVLNNSFYEEGIFVYWVVNWKGELIGCNYFFIFMLMQEWFEEEGIWVEDNCVVDFDEVFWYFKVLGMDYEVKVD